MQKRKGKIYYSSEGISPPVRISIGLFCAIGVGIIGHMFFPNIKRLMGFSMMNESTLRLYLDCVIFGVGSAFLWQLWPIFVVVIFIAGVTSIFYGNQAGIFSMTIIAFTVVSLEFFPQRLRK